MQILLNEITSICTDDCGCPSSPAIVSDNSNPQTSNPQTYNYKNQLYTARSIDSPDVLKINLEKCQYSCVIAHLNTMRVAEFFENHLQILGFESKYEYISCINCVSPEYGKDFAFFAYKTACDAEKWTPRVFFGTKKLSSGNFCSYAISATAVAHEFAHKLIYETIEGGQGFDYNNPQSGALEESYADIFAILFANRNQPNIGQWDWEIGNGFGLNGSALRDVRSPRNYDDPDHMRDYMNLPTDRSGDSNGCHTNNGIHNKALYYLLNSKVKDGKYLRYLFDVSSAVKLFYLALTELKINSKANFENSLNALINASRILSQRSEIIKSQREVEDAVIRSFAQVGILESKRPDYSL
jgi:Zn-dependent metalloprotease